MPTTFGTLNPIKPNKALDAFKTNQVQNFATQVNPIPQLGVQSSDTMNSDATKLQPMGNTNSSAFATAGNQQNNQVRSLITSQPFQPMFTRNGLDPADSSLSRLNSINQTTDLLNAQSQQNVINANRRIAAYNQRNMQAQQGYAQSQYNSASGLDQEQFANASQIARIGQQRGMSASDIQTAIMTALTESQLRNVQYGDRDSLGLFQQRPSQGWGTAQQVMDPNYSINKFYDSLSGVGNRGAMAPWQAAQTVQRSAFSDGSNYQKNYALAQQAYNAFSNPQVSLQSNNITPIASGKGQAAAGWIGANNNKYIDYDGAWGAQCVDLYAAYTHNFLGGNPFPVGYAPEIINKYDSRVYTRLGNNAPAQMADVVVFGPGPYTPSGHVAIVVGDNGNGTLRVLQSNATPAGSAGNSIISNISKQSVLGYLRPNRFM